MTKVFSYCTDVDSINDHYSSGGMTETMEGKLIGQTIVFFEFINPPIHRVRMHRPDSATEQYEGWLYQVALEMCSKNL